MCIRDRDPGEQLLVRERLGEVVVGARSQAVHPVPYGARRRQHQHPGQQSLRHHPAAHVVAVQAGQIAVQDEHVVGAEPQLFQGHSPAVGDIDRDRVAAQALGDHFREEFLVLHHQHAHGVMCTRGTPFAGVSTCRCLSLGVTHAFAVSGGLPWVVPLWAVGGGFAPTPSNGRRIRSIRVASGTPPLVLPRPAHRRAYDPLRPSGGGRVIPRPGNGDLRRSTVASGRGRVEGNAA